MLHAMKTELIDYLWSTFRTFTLVKPSSLSLVISTKWPITSWNCLSPESGRMMDERSAPATCICIRIRSVMMSPFTIEMVKVYWLHHTSDILRKSPLLLLPKSKKNRFWSARITFDVPNPPTSSCGGNSINRSTLSSADPDANWVLRPGMKPAPTSSESPGSRSEGSICCCCNWHGWKTMNTWTILKISWFNRRFTKHVYLIRYHEKLWAFLIYLQQYVPECSPPFSTRAPCRNNNRAAISINRCFWDLFNKQLHQIFVQVLKSYAKLSFCSRQKIIKLNKIINWACKNYHGNTVCWVLAWC